MQFSCRHLRPLQSVESRHFHFISTVTVALDFCEFIESIAKEVLQLNLGVLAFSQPLIKLPKKKCFKCKILVMNFLYFLCRAAMFDLSTARPASGIFSFS